MVLDISTMELTAGHNHPTLMADDDANTKCASRTRQNFKRSFQNGLGWVQPRGGPRSVWEEKPVAVKTTVVGGKLYSIVTNWKWP